VDDAIVIADNYVELLDRMCLLRSRLAFRNDMAVPVLRGDAERLSLHSCHWSRFPGRLVNSSWRCRSAWRWVGMFVCRAMLLTPICADFFIKQVCTAVVQEEVRHPDFMQAAYNRAIALLMRGKSIAIGAGLVAIVGAFFFRDSPAANSFPPQNGTMFVHRRVDPSRVTPRGTDRVIERITDVPCEKPAVEHVASFAGQSFSPVLLQT